MDKRDETIHPCDVLRIPVFATYRAYKGIVVNKSMFAESNVIVLQYVEDEGNTRRMFVKQPVHWELGKNYWDTDRNGWLIE